MNKTGTLDIVLTTTYLLQFIYEFIFDLFITN